MFFGDVPPQVQKALTDKHVWWNNSQRSTMRQFLDGYTLHDSYWIGIYFHLNGTCDLLLNWDTIFIDPSVKHLDLPMRINDGNRKSYGGEWPYLCISFQSVHQIISDQHDKGVVSNVVARAETRGISSEQRMLWLDFLSKQSVISVDAGGFLLDDELQCTTIEGIEGDHTHIFHSEPTLFLCIKDDGSPLQIPDL